MKKTVSNIFYNALYNLMILFIPLITVPFVARTLGKDSVGINAFVISVVTFLQMIIPAATAQIGTKEIAQHQHDDDLPRIFMNLWSLQFFIGIIATVGFLIFSLMSPVYNKYFLLTIPLLVSTTIDISWFFVGIGEIKKVIIRNTAIKVASLILIFTLIRKPSDLGLYIAINSFATLIANSVFLLTIIDKFGKKLKLKFLRFSKKYLSKSIFLMVPQFAAQLYSNFDNVLVGAFAGATQLAYYDQSQRVARMILGVVTSVSVVLMPKFAEYAVDSDNDSKVIRLMRKSLEYTLASALFFTVILMANTSDFVVFYWGSAFSKMTPNMFVISLIIIFIAVGGVFANQFALAKGYYRAFALPYIIGAVVNLSLNFILVPYFKSMGGTIVLLITEMVVCFFRIFFLRNVVDLNYLFHGFYRYLVIFLITLGLGVIIPMPEMTLFFRLALRSIIIFALYVGMLIVFKTNIYLELKQKFAHKR